MINHKHGLSLKNYHELHEYSVRDYAFWLDLWEFTGVISSVAPNPSRVRAYRCALLTFALHINDFKSLLQIIENGRTPYLPRWFPDVRLNYAENLLKRCDDGIAVTFARESALGAKLNGGDHKIEHVTWRELRKRVAELASALKAEGVGIGDRVAPILSNSSTAVAFALAVIAVGAVVSPTAPDMGARGILERYRQIRPCLIVAETSALYAGKYIDLTPKLREVAQELKNFGLKKVVLVPGAGDELKGEGGRGVPLGVSVKEFLDRGNAHPVPLIFEQLPFSHPLYILFSSGTSGPPKCIIHSAGGILLQLMKDLGVGFGMGMDDTYFQFTTTGWMMWPYMLSALACGVRIVAYDGSPFHPDVREFLKFVSEQRVTVFGTSPRFLSEVQSRNIHPLSLAPFDSLRAILSTGSVLTAPMFEWTQRAFGPSVHIASSSGGTDICGCFVSLIESQPVHSGEIQGKALGMAVEIFDPAGRNIEHTGTPGELVCTRPHPSLPIAFWGDEDGEKFRKAYFDVYPGVWRQGDFIVLNPRTKGLMILGRSDGVLNPSGVRFGSAEIYAALESPPPPFDFAHIISDSLCVGQRRPGDTDERVLLFLKMRDGHKLTAKLEKEIREAIRKALSARHVPTYIGEVDDIPYTVNNKKVEIAVKQIVSGNTLTPSGTIANPESLKQYYQFRDIESFLAKRSEGLNGLGEGLSVGLKAKL
ncbi:hypothetical protein EW145_g5069 [Phellinidium pouzarii]|uniref:AMP-dependent synthetase/ligase domain-containing protein n=1 Tax=Phellinidium pouzarii TaxID=167371 RepID=A0A4S4L1V2_9AGAM|nr:hypothetical protein EW145_g5069 [Phellinidium pouzarii]